MAERTFLDLAEINQIPGEQSLIRNVLQLQARFRSPEHTAAAYLAACGLLQQSGAPNAPPLTDESLASAGLRALQPGWFPRTSAALPFLATIQETTANPNAKRLTTIALRNHALASGVEAALAMLAGKLTIKPSDSMEKVLVATADYARSKHIFEGLGQDAAGPYLRARDEGPSLP